MAWTMTVTTLIHHGNGVLCPETTSGGKPTAYAPSRWKSSCVLGARCAIGEIILSGVRRVGHSRSLVPSSATGTRTSVAAGPSTWLCTWVVGTRARPLSGCGAILAVTLTPLSKRRTRKPMQIRCPVWHRRPVPYLLQDPVGHGAPKTTKISLGTVLANSFGCQHQAQPISNAYAAISLSDVVSLR
jgi:hypothetical protein